MSRILSFCIFLVVFFAIDFYVFQGYKLLVRRWIPSYSTLLHIVYWAVPVILLLLIIGTMVWSPQPTKSKVMLWSSSILFGIFIAKFVWLLFMVLDDLVRIIRLGGQRVSSEPGVKPISRSQFIVTTGALLAGTLFGTMIYGIARGAHNYTVMRRRLKLKNLPKAFQGFKIVQISDVHSGSFWSKDGVKRGIQMILDQKPDAIFFTGDLVNSKTSEFEDFKEIFGRLEAPYGVYSVLGNHDYGDYYRWPDKNGVTKEQNLQQLINHQSDMGWNLLMNESKIIEKDGEKLGVLGVENWSGHKRFPKYGKLDQAYAGVADVENKLLLSHDPSHWRAEVLKDYPTIDAMFSGHTHGMQFGIDTKYYKWSPVKYQYPEWADLYEENGQYLYVNRGFGYLGFPGRVGFLPEITVFELETA
ncbi:MAG: metallophosphoesterase [Bacteroidetes bacterium]|jgi:predicted MPP superfamily phosphohydrolase|nr:metallophosphoesterase [Bacteroidota bacterium]